ncbi:pentapeptide repeat-containing protein [Streptomyces varsoviensis]|uniref:pentapeptide repeat-containing protein n=1 Tax=Streptomyces varsoviensis TaxID=67373 RepID=UPI0033DD245F
MDVEAVGVDGCSFANVRFTGSSLRQSQLSDRRIEGCDFSQVAAGNVSLNHCAVNGSRLSGSSWD